MYSYGFHTERARKRIHTHTHTHPFSFRDNFVTNMKAQHMQRVQCDHNSLHFAESDREARLIDHRVDEGANRFEARGCATRCRSIAPGHLFVRHTRI